MTSNPGSVPLELCRFAVVDVETTGGGTRPESGGRVLEVAVAVLEQGTVHLVCDMLLDPGVPIPAAVARLTGITDRLVAGSPRFADAAPALRRAWEDGVFVAHNARYDWAFLAAECAAAGVPGPAGAPLCTIRLTRRLAPELRHRRLDQVASFFGVHNLARHRAFGDALATAYILRALLGRAAERGITTFADLVDLHDRSRHSKTRNAEGGTRNVGGNVETQATSHFCSAFRVPPFAF